MDRGAIQFGSGQSKDHNTVKQYLTGSGCLGIYKTAVNDFNIKACIHSIMMIEQCFVYRYTLRYSIGGGARP